MTSAVFSSVKRKGAEQFDLLCTTPLRDVLRGRLTGRLNIDRITADAQLPPSLAQLVKDTAQRTRLWRIEKSDVAAELAAHFADGLAAGKSSEELAESFGDPAQLAILIRRAKKRNRPLPWRVMKRSMQVLGIVIILYLLAAVYFLAGRPAPSHNYLKDLNAAALSLKESQRAWPLYRAARLALPALDEQLPDGVDAAALRPGDAHWPVVEQYLVAHASTLETIRRAAQMPGLGYVVGHEIAPDDRELWPEMQAADTSEFGDSCFTTLLPHLRELRSLSRLLVMDTCRAAHVGDGATALANIEAGLGLGQHARETPFIINELVGIAITRAVFESVGELLAHFPEILSDEQLGRLAHVLSTYDERALRIRLSGERFGFADFLQRIYTDSGNGDGRLTVDGLVMLLKAKHAGTLTDAPPADPPRAVLAAATPALGMVMLSRREMMDEYDRLLAIIEAENATPLWLRGEPAAEQQIQQWSAAPLQQLRRWPIVILMPALSRTTIQSQMMLMHRDALMTAIALELYRRSHGVWPDSLHELVPSLLPAVPVDRFDGQLLRYAIIDGQPRLYSVGSNLIDEGGEPPYDASGQPNNSAAGRWFPPQRVRNWNATAHGPSPWVDGDWILWPPLPCE